MDTKPPKWEPPIQYPYNGTNSTYPPIGQQYPAYPPQAIPTRNEGWFERNQRNKPQSNSVGAAALVLTTGGMSMAWGLGFNNRSNTDISIYMNVCWFVMAIVGAVVSASLTNVVKKRNLMLLSTIMVLLGGILFISLHDDDGALMAARHLNGFAIGLLLVSTLVMAGEEAVVELRGMLASSIEMMCFTLGTYLQIIYAVSYSEADSFGSNQIHGLLLIIFSAISLLIIFFLVVESPVYFLVRNQEQEAIDCLRRLQCPSVVTHETYAQLQALKSYIAYNKEKSRYEAFRDSIPALFKLSILRGIVGMSFSLVINLALLYSSSRAEYTIWPAILYGTCRYLGVIISVFLQDTMGRKKPLAFGMLISGVLVFSVASCFTNFSGLYNESTMTSAMFLLIFYQFFIGLAIASSSSYLSEAFPLAVKPYCIAIAFGVEMLSQILCASIDLSWEAYSQLCYVLGSFSLAYFALTFYCLPETKKTTLRDAQIKFQSWYSRGCNVITLQE